jgi:hypothetical protein
MHSVYRLSQSFSVNFDRRRCALSDPQACCLPRHLLLHLRDSNHLNCGSLRCILFLRIIFSQSFLFCFEVCVIMLESLTCSLLRLQTLDGYSTEALLGDLNWLSAKSGVSIVESNGVSNEVSASFFLRYYELICSHNWLLEVGQCNYTVNIRRT